MTKAVTLKDKNNEAIYPVTDVSLVNNGIYADDVVPVQEIPVINTPMIEDEAVTAAKIFGGVDGNSLANGALVEVVGSATSGTSANYAWKFADGRLICFQTYDVSGNCTNAWGNAYSGVQMTPKNYVVEFAHTPVVVAQLNCSNASGNCWLAQANEAGAASTQHPCGYQLVRPNSMSNLRTQISVVAYGFWKD